MKQKGTYWKSERDQYLSKRGKKIQLNAWKILSLAKRKAWELKIMWKDFFILEQSGVSLMEILSVID